MRALRRKRMCLVRLIYTSRAVQALQATDLQRLVEAAGRNNWRDEITGALLFHHGRFIEVLEGARADVSACFLRIAKDARHRDCVLLGLQDIPERAFGAWSMKLLPWSPSIAGDVESIFESADSGEADRVASAVSVMQRLAAAPLVVPA
mgnify:CR=1 FL=1